MTIQKAGELCREARKRRGLSQAETADLAEHTQSGVCHFECGKKTVQLGTLMRIMDAVGLKMKCGTVVANNPGEVYGVIGTAMLKRKWDNKKLSEASGVPFGTLYAWTQKTIRAANADSVFKALNALKLETDLIEV